MPIMLCGTAKYQQLWATYCIAVNALYFIAVNHQYCIAANALLGVPEKLTCDLWFFSKSLIAHIYTIQIQYKWKKNVHWYKNQNQVYSQWPYSCGMYICNIQSLFLSYIIGLVGHIICWASFFLGYILVLSLVLYDYESIHLKKYICMEL